MLHCYVRQSTVFQLIAQCAGWFVASLLLVVRTGCYWLPLQDERRQLKPCMCSRVPRALFESWDSSVYGGMSSIEYCHLV